MNHRKPPLPASMKAHQPGVCRWCGQPVLTPAGQPTKGTWHPRCVTAFKLLCWPAETRKAVWARDRGRCAHCRKRVGDYRQIADWFVFDRDRDSSKLAGRRAILSRHQARLRAAWGARDRTWQHDHIRPLVEAEGRIEFWQMANLQLLCSPCHIAKGREDNRRRKQQRTLDGPLVQPELAL